MIKKNKVKKIEWIRIFNILCTHTCPTEIDTTLPKGRKTYMELPKKVEPIIIKATSFINTVENVTLARAYFYKFETDQVKYHINFSYLTFMSKWTTICQN